MSAAANKKAAFSRSSIVIAILAVVALAAAIGVFLNEPVGPATRIRGALETNCVPRGKQSNLFDCTAKLTDGSYQTFRELRPLRGGTSVTFLRRDRKYVGRYYELADVAL
jgi:hypothetical protein